MSASSSSGGDDPIERLKGLSSISTNQARRAVFLLFLAPIAEFAFGIVDLIDALFNVIVAPINALITGLGSLVLAIVGGAADIVDAGSGAAARAFLTGIWSSLGPFAFPAAIATIGLGAWVLAQVLQEQETSDSITGLFTGIDLPDLGPFRFGVSEEDEEGAE